MRWAIAFYLPETTTVGQRNSFVIMEEPNRKQKKRKKNKSLLHLLFVRSFFVQLIACSQCEGYKSPAHSKSSGDRVSYHTTLGIDIVDVDAVFFAARCSMLDARLTCNVQSTAVRFGPMANTIKLPEECFILLRCGMRTKKKSLT